ncbi:hypothetical protein ACFQ88_23410 [Paenibacillus sp. NPDC056579]|uniref:hypothetical protein n=1 Tax=Paenibacillus sp. NPDC056579 TaxID=3345871 RepID=UPI00367E0DA4
MSTQDRKIGFYGLQFEKYNDRELFFDRVLFKDFIENVLLRPTNEQMINIHRHNKAITIDKYAITEYYADFLIRIVYKSCKYNHNPDYMSSLDGTERESDKKPFEGEKEKTHLCIRISTYEAELILEERRSGVSINEIVNYLNKMLRKYLINKNLPKNFKIKYGIVPSKNFLEILKTMKDVKIAELHTNKFMIGSEAMNLLEHEDKSMKDDIVITMKAFAKESLLKRNISKLYSSLTTTQSKISRIRLYGHDQEGKFIRLDTDNSRKMQYIEVSLDANGTVNTDSIFEKMYALLGINEENK